MSYLSFIRRSWGIDPKTIWLDIFSRKDPDEFLATGSQIYHGRQRQGKTLGMVEGFHRLKRRYPKSLIVSNIHINYKIVIKPEKKYIFFRQYDKAHFNEVRVDTESQLREILAMPSFITGEWQESNYIYYQSYDALLMLLKKARNNRWGVVFMIDEIHQYFHSHDSKAMPVWVAQIFSQQMKQFILVLGTVQVWENVIKALREQIQHLILANRVGWYIRQTVIDPEDIENEYGEKTAVVKKKGGFFMNKLVRESYDTLGLIESGREIFGGMDAPNIVVNADKQKPKSNLYKRRAKL